MVHATAILEGEIDLADDVEIGPHCVLRGDIRLGPGCRLIGHAYLQGPLTLGAGNVVYPFCCLGFAPQHMRYDPQKDGHGLAIGDGNTFREQVTVHRAYTDEGPTRIGDRNFFMSHSHVGHDCQVGNDCVLVNDAMLGGHVTIEDRVTLGGNATIHQFCRVGRGAMLSGLMGLARDLPPWFMLTGTNVCGSVNLVGLRRSGMSPEEIDEVRWVYRTLYRRGLPAAAAIEALRARADRPIVADYLRFFELGRRGLCPGTPRPVRGNVQLPVGEEVSKAELRASSAET